MRLGIFAKTFVRPTLEQTLDAVKTHGLDCVQFNMACAGLPTLPEQIEPTVCARIRRETAKRGIAIAAVSGTFNMIHPDRNVRRHGLDALAVLAEACHDLGAAIITLGTGTRDRHDMWRRHPANSTPQAWADLLYSVTKAVDTRVAHDITLAFEPEVNNVVNSARKARRLLDEIDSPNLKVVIDPANLFHEGELARQHEILEEAFDLLGRDIVLAHAKDISRDGDSGHEAAGKGLLDYDYYLQCLRRIGYDGPLILHGLEEAQVDECLAFLRGKMKSC